MCLCNRFNQPLSFHRTKCLFYIFLCGIILFGTSCFAPLIILAGERTALSFSLCSGREGVVVCVEEWRWRRLKKGVSSISSHSTIQGMRVVHAGRVQRKRHTGDIRGDTRGVCTGGPGHHCGEEQSIPCIWTISAHWVRAHTHQPPTAAAPSLHPQAAPEESQIPCRGATGWGCGVHKGRISSVCWVCFSSAWVHGLCRHCGYGILLVEDESPWANSAELCSFQKT